MYKSPKQKDQSLTDKASLLFLDAEKIATDISRKNFEIKTQEDALTTALTPIVLSAVVGAKKSDAAIMIFQVAGSFDLKATEIREKLREMKNATDKATLEKRANTYNEVSKILCNLSNIDGLRDDKSKATSK